jgi:hypothetical protein
MTALTHSIDDFTLEFGSCSVSLPLVIGKASKTGNGSFQIAFTNSPGFSFSVLATTALALPLSNWIFLGTPTEITPGNYQFIDSQATNVPHKFYKVLSP